MKNSTPYSEALEIIALYKTKNTIHSFDNRSVRVVHEDGTTLFFDAAFTIRYKDYHIICTEHHGYFAYHIDDAKVRQYTDKPVLKPSLNRKDTCEGCNKILDISGLTYRSVSTDKGCGISVLCDECADKEF